MELKIPPCPARATDGSTWPRHAAKARRKTYNRRRVMIAALPQEDRRGASFCI